MISDFLKILDIWTMIRECPLPFLCQLFVVPYSFLNRHHYQYHQFSLFLPHLQSWPWGHSMYLFLASSGYWIWLLCESLWIILQRRHHHRGRQNSGKLFHPWIQTHFPWTWTIYWLEFLGKLDPLTKFLEKTRPFQPSHRVVYRSDSFSSI